MCRRKPDVDDDDVERVAAHLEQQVIRRGALRYDLEAGFAEQPRDPFTEQDAVFGDRYAHGISARTRVPPPAGLQMRSLPPCASTRSASPRSPEPRSVSAPPTPSSTTSTTTPVGCLLDVDPDRGRLGVLADVRETLRDDVVGRDLDLLGQPLFEAHRQLDGSRRMRGDRLERHLEAVPAEHGRMETARNRAKLVERHRDLASRLIEPSPPSRDRPPASSRAGSTRARERSVAAAHRHGGCAPAAGAPSGPPRSPVRASLSAPPGAPSARPAAARSRARSRPPHRRRPSSSGSSSSAGSCNSAATCAPSRSINVAVRRPPGAGNATRRPSRSAQVSNSGSQYASVSVGSRSARASASCRPAGDGSARNSTKRSPTAERASRASRSAIRNTIGEIPITIRVARWIVWNAGPPVAPITNNTAIISEPDRKRVDQERERTPKRPPRLPPPCQQHADANHAQGADREQLDLLHAMPLPPLAW